MELMQLTVQSLSTHKYNELVLYYQNQLFNLWKTTLRYSIESQQMFLTELD